jgi:Ion channel
MYLPWSRHPLPDAFFALACFASFVVVLLLQVFRPGLITLHRVLGAVAAYISIGITSGYAYYATSLVNPGVIRFESPLQAYDIPSARYIYFSLTTLTTVGYGDAVPVHPVTRALARCGSFDWATLSCNIDCGSAGVGASNEISRRKIEGRHHAVERHAVKRPGGHDRVAHRKLANGVPADWVGARVQSGSYFYLPFSTGYPFSTQSAAKEFGRFKTRKLWKPMSRRAVKPGRRFGQWSSGQQPQ